MSKLKVCPFCGSDEISLSDSRYQSGAIADKFAECHKCASTGPGIDMEKSDIPEIEAIEAWNRREG